VAERRTTAMMKESGKPRVMESRSFSSDMVGNGRRMPLELTYDDTQS